MCIKRAVARLAGVYWNFQKLVILYGTIFCYSLNWWLTECPTVALLVHIEFLLAACVSSVPAIQHSNYPNYSAVFTTVHKLINFLNLTSNIQWAFIRCVIICIGFQSSQEFSSSCVWWCISSTLATVRLTSMILCNSLLTMLVVQVFVLLQLPGTFYQGCALSLGSAPSFLWP